jgi:hypothetical protein
MSWLTLNGIELSSVVALDSEPTGARREVGSVTEAADGTLVLTRQARKRDLRFDTIPLSGSDARAWEALFTGEGHVWSFDVSKYSSKGLAPGDADGTLETATPSPKYGAKYLELIIDATINWNLGADFVSAWTVAAWMNNSSVFGDSAWHHFGVTSDGDTFVDGALDETPPVPVTLSLVAGVLQLVGPDPGPVHIDDLVAFPAVWPADWFAQVAAATAAFGSTPYLTAAGLLVPEAATRSMICTSCEETIMLANLSDGLGRRQDVRTLSVELKGR